MKNSFKKIGLFILLGVSMVSCTSSSTPTTAGACSTSSSDFQTIFNTVLSSNSLYDDHTTMDLVTHEYTFIMLADKSICQIGYQGNANLYAASIPYTIEIYDNTTSSMVYSGSHIFNNAFTDYVTPTGPTVILLNGHSYTIRRKASNYLGNIGNTIGRICRFNSGGLPTSATGVFMKITTSNFYGTGGPVPNYGIPYIDIIFQ